MLGGLFGPALAHWVGRFKYWAIFLAAMLSTQALFVVGMVRKLGLKNLIAAFVSGIDAVFFFVPMGIGVIAVFIAFVGSLSVPKEDSANKSENK